MKAVAIVAPRQVEIRETPVPQPPPGWLVARVRAAGLCGSDVKIYHGTLPYLRSGAVRYPITPGHEWAGEVTALGEGVSGFAVGDRVTSETHVGCGGCDACRDGCYNLCPDLRRTGMGDLPGACAEYICVPARSAHRLPKGMTFEQGALVEPTTVAFYGLQRAGLRGGERTVVVGPGPIGLLAVACARALGSAEVILLGTRDERLAAGTQMGADRVINVRTQFGAEVELTNYADVIAEATGRPEALAQALAMARPGGAICLLGLYPAPADGLDLTLIVRKGLRIVGSLGSPGVWPRVLALIGAERFDPRLLVTHRFRLEQAVQAFETVIERRGGAIKVLFEA